MDLRDLAKAILSIDDSKLSSEDIKFISSQLPSPDEVALLFSITDVGADKLQCAGRSAQGYLSCHKNGQG